MATTPKMDDARWLALCASKGQESPDPRTKIGCLIIAPDGNVRCASCNDYPQGTLRGIGERVEAPLKYVWFEHAERNAIYLAARQGLPTEGCTMFVELIPCIECARAIIQAGIIQVVINRDRCVEYQGSKYSGEVPTAMAMLAEAGINVRFAKPGVASEVSQVEGGRFLLTPQVAIDRALVTNPRKTRKQLLGRKTGKRTAG